MQPNYMYYPRVLQQGGNNFGPSGSVIGDSKDQRRIMDKRPGYLYNNQSYMNNNQFKSEEEQTCSYKFIKIFSYLPCLPSSWSRVTKGIVGLFVFLAFIAIAAVALGLIPVYIDAINSSDNVKEPFSIDVVKGLQLQNQPLFDILSISDEQNRTSEQNSTLFTEINSLSAQLNEKVKPLLDSNLDKIYNIRLVPNQARSIDVSYSIKTNPILKAESITLKEKINNLLKDSNTFNNVISTNSTLALNTKLEEIVVSDPIRGEIPTESFLLLTGPISKPKLESDLLQDELMTNFGLQLKKKDKPDDHDHEAIVSSSNIKRLRDDIVYENERKYPVYYPAPKYTYDISYYESTYPTPIEYEMGNKPEYKESPYAPYPPKQTYTPEYVNYEATYPRPEPPYHVDKNVYPDGDSKRPHRPDRPHRPNHFGVDHKADLKDERREEVDLKDANRPEAELKDQNKEEVTKKIGLKEENSNENEEDLETVVTKTMSSTVSLKLSQTAEKEMNSTTLASSTVKLLATKEAVIESNTKNSTLSSNLNTSSSSKSTNQTTNSITTPTLVKS